MSRHRGRLLTRLGGMVLGVVLLALTGPAVAVDFEHSRLVVETVTGAHYRFEIELAKTPDQLHQGLMFRDHLADDAGMLFLLGSEQIATFWMRNTFVPLDMLFIGRGGRIVNIRRNAVPGSSDLLTSERPVVAVLEVRAGLSARLGIRAGDRVVHPALD